MAPDPKPTVDTSGPDGSDSSLASVGSSSGGDQHREHRRAAAAIGRARLRRTQPGRRKSKPKANRPYRASRGKGNVKNGDTDEDEEEREDRMLRRLPGTTYPIWKWPLVFCLGAVVFGIAIGHAVEYATPKLRPICSVPLVGSRLPFCPPIRPAHTIDVSKVGDSQEHLNLVRSQVGQSYELATRMWSNTFTIRDLKTRVKYSDLSRKSELVEELDLLLKYAKQTSKGLSRFTAKTYKTIDAVVSFDRYAAKQLQGILDKRNHSSALSNRMWSAIGIHKRTEAEVRDAVLSTSGYVAGKVKVLSEAALAQERNLDLILESLDRIKELCRAELGDLPTWHVLAKLWARLIDSPTLAEWQSHETLLRDAEEVFHNAKDIVKTTTVALNIMDAELEEFYEEASEARLTLENWPLEVSLAMLGKAAGRLEDGGNLVGYGKYGKIERIQVTVH